MYWEHESQGTCGMAPHTVPETVREFDSAGEHEGRRRQTGRETAPQRNPKCLIAHAATAMARDASASCSAVGPCDRRPGLSKGGALFRSRRHRRRHRHECGAHGCATVRPRGPVMGCIACAASPPGYAPKGPRGGQYHIQQASRRTRAPLSAPSWRRVGQIGEALETRAVRRCPGAGGDGLRIRIGASHSRHLRNRSTRSVGVHSAVCYGTRCRPWWAGLLAEEAKARLSLWQSVSQPPPVVIGQKGQG